MYLFAYLLGVTSDCIAEIKTSLAVISMLSLLIEQYGIKHTRCPKAKATETNVCAEIIMDEYVTLLATKSSRRRRQHQFYKLHHSTPIPKAPSTRPLTDRVEFLDFFDSLYHQ